MKQLCKILTACSFSLVLGIGFQDRTHAQLWDGRKALEPSFHFRVKAERAGNVVLGYRAMVRTELASFTFLIPDELKALADQKTRRIVLVDRNSAPVVSMVFSEPPLPGEVPKEPKAADLKSFALQQEPAAKVVEEFQLSAGSFVGPAVEVEWNLGSDLRTLQSRRYLRVLAMGLGVDFQRLCTTATRTDADRYFNSVLITFRGADSEEKLAVAPLSDKL